MKPVGAKTEAFRMEKLGSANAVTMIAAMIVASK
jgi:hypothetical protein